MASLHAQHFAEVPYQPCPIQAVLLQINFPESDCSLLPLMDSGRMIESAAA